MANYLSLEEAAKKLGIPTDRLVELRSQGQVRGFRDGHSWKFPDTEIDRLADDIGDLLAGGSGLLVSEQEVGSSLGIGSKIIGGDGSESDGSGSDLDLGMETIIEGSGGSDVNLVASDSSGSDVALVTSKSGIEKKARESGLQEIDSSDLTLEEPAILHDSGELDLGLEPKSGSTGPITDAELREIGDSTPDALAGKKKAQSASDSGLDFGDDEDSGDMIIANDDDSADLMLGADSDLDLSMRPSGASSLELMSDLDSAASGSGMLSKSSVGGDVLSELDLLSAEAGGSGLISGDSEALLGGSSGSLGLSGAGSSLAGLDDALDDDDDLMIADDDDDLVISSAGGDISIAGDSGINLMSPSDSGLSLESEPLDLAGSGLSALDLGAELNDGSGIGSGKGSSGKLDKSGSGVDFESDEEFQLSPSGVGLEVDIESGSQVIEVEDSDAIGEPVEFGEVAMDDADPFGGDAFGGDGFGNADAVVVDESGMVESEAGLGIDDSAVPVGRGAPVGYEIPFTTLQVVGLLMIICMLSLGGMLMTDLIRNMWTYQETSAPVSSLTDSLISLMGWES